ncbi:hypothetical protein DFJ73DRAFT_833369, partial [Zopfochytrium polystomum]
MALARTVLAVVAAGAVDTRRATRAVCVARRRSAKVRETEILSEDTMISPGAMTVMDSLGGIGTAKEMGPDGTETARATEVTATGG